MLERIQLIHNAGFAFCDLKLENILIGIHQSLPKPSAHDIKELLKDKNIFKNISINLIDLGMSKRFINKDTGEHIFRHDVKEFEGNLITASINQLQFMSPSARDDLESIVYIVCFIANKGKLPGIKASYDDFSIGIK